MLPLRTDRLLLRMMRAADVDALVAYRNDPQIGHFQDWPQPYTVDMGQAMIREQAALDQPESGRWVQLAIEAEGQVVGDLGVELRHGGTLATVGYTLAAAHQGKGYAREALAGLVDALCAAGVHRIDASLDPDNVPSMRVLEAAGFTFECLARQGDFVHGQWVDDLRYALLADDRAAWLARNLRPPAVIDLVEITPDDAHLWGRLATHHSQQRFVSPMALSFRDALFPDVVNGAPVQPWMRGVLADGERVAFVMVAAATAHHPEPYLWRLLVDRAHQRRGIGERVVAMLVDQFRADGHSSMTVSWVGGIAGTPQPFYEKLGFVPTGEKDGIETVGRLTW